MGAGIAELVAGHGHGVALHDADHHAAKAGRERAAARLRRAHPDDVELAEAAADRIVPTADLGAACANADVVVEAVPERLALKRAVLNQIAREAPQATLLATNTSALPIAELASSVTDPTRFVGLHFFNPPAKMQLVEVVRGPTTSEHTVARACALAMGLDREPVVVRDSPGFATSRLGVLLGVEAARMVEEGVAAPEAIDRAMQLGYGHPMGPLRLTDLVGVDVRRDIACSLAEALGERFRPPALLDTMVAENRLGRKTGHGFYAWDSPA